MKISTFLPQIIAAVRTGEVKNLDEALSILKPQGLTMLEMGTSTFDSLFKPDELLGIMKNHDMSVSSIYYMAEFNFENENFMSEMKEDTKRKLETCAIMETPFLMVVPKINNPNMYVAKQDVQKMIAAYLNDVCELTKQYNITTVMENYSDPAVSIATPEEIGVLLKEVPQLYYVLDTGNFWFSDSDVYKASRLFADRIRHVHLKDIMPSETGLVKSNNKVCDSNEIGSGIIDFDKIFEVLGSISYDDAVTIEINSPGNDLKKIELSIEYLKSKFIK
ncbi:MAG: sugar phosphate isomerase/epimerase [Clostridia bacterium]|nr:sugar phosphate isomerase/epimerase [Clostridia bacterium]